MSDSNTITISADVNRNGKTSIYLDPEARQVYTWGGAQGTVGCPDGVWHKRHADLGTFERDIDADSLQELLESYADDLAEICDLYEGTQWNGFSHIGAWAEGASDAIDALRRSLADQIADLATYWDAGDWIYQDKKGAVEEALASDSLKAWAEAEVARWSRDALLDAGELEEAMREILEEDLAEMEEELSEMDAEEEEEAQALEADCALLRRLLA